MRGDSTGLSGKTVRTAATRHCFIFLSCYWPKAENLGGLGAEPPRSLPLDWHAPIMLGDFAFALLCILAEALHKF
jgi:hypothetical protein